MESIDIILRYFPELSFDQQNQLIRFEAGLFDWNTKINLVSRKEIHLLAERHILHSLAIAKILKFEPNSRIMDAGTGGGFPGIPLAVYFPKTQFILVDSIHKKINALEDIVVKTGLHNVNTINERVEKIQGKFDFIVSRAVTRLGTFIDWTWDKIKTDHKNEIKNGILYLKGGDLTDEIAELKYRSEVFNLNAYFKEPFFESKKIVYIPKIG